MIFKAERYTAQDGEHWPDMYMGAESIVTLPRDGIDSVTAKLVAVDWSSDSVCIELGVSTVDDTHLTLHVKALRPGSFRVKCACTLEEKVHPSSLSGTFTKIINMMVRVY